MRRVQRGMRHAPVPNLDARLRRVADALAAELIREIAGRDRFRAVTPDGLYRTAETFARYRWASLDVIRRTDRGARRTCLSDLR